MRSRANGSIARVSDDRKPRFWRADTVEVLEPSEHRQPHVWASAALERDPADRAGGAEFGHIELSHQRELKRQVLADALSRMAGMQSDVVVEPVAGETDGLGWRTRVRLHVDDDGRVGPYAARTHRVIEVPDLPLATPAVAAAAPLADRFPGEQAVDVLGPSTGGVRLVVGAQKPTTITEVVGDREFRLDDTGFWQVHHGAAETLTAAVQDAVVPERFDPTAANLDLYGGVGLFAAALGRPIRRPADHQRRVRPSRNGIRRAQPLRVGRGTGGDRPGGALGSRARGLGIRWRTGPSGECDGGARPASERRRPRGGRSPREPGRRADRVRRVRPGVIRP